MQRKRMKLAAGLIAAALVLTGCGGGAPAPGAGGAGGDPDPEERVVWEAPSAEELPQAVRDWVAEHQHQLGIFQQVFEDQTYVMVAWGEKPTGGYTVEVADVGLDGGVLRLSVRLKEPGPDDMVTEALTYPYAVVAVSPSGVYELNPEFEGAPFLQNRAFRLELPELFARVGQEVRIKGEARVFEGVFQITVEDGHNVLADQVMQVAGAPAWAPFDVTLQLTEAPTSPNGTVLIYTHSAEDGSVIDQIAVPVVFESWE